MVIDDNERARLMKFRLTIEAKVGELVPKTGDKSEDNLASRLGRLNKDFSQREQMISKRFLRVANPLHHELHPNLTASDIEQFKQDYYDLERTLERLKASRNSYSFFSSSSSSRSSTSSTGNNDTSLLGMVVGIIAHFLGELLSFNLERIISALFGMLFLGVIVWLVWMFTWPFIYSLFPLYIIAVAFYYYEYRMLILPLSFISAIYICVNLGHDWYNFELVKNFKSLGSIYRWIFFIDIIAAVSSLLIVTQMFWYPSTQHLFTWQYWKQLIKQKFSL